MVKHVLEKKYGQKVVVLIDEYDVPLQKSLYAGLLRQDGTFNKQSVWKCAKTNEKPCVCISDRVCHRIAKKYLYGT